MTAQIINFNQRKMEMRKDVVRANDYNLEAFYPTIRLEGFDGQVDGKFDAKSLRFCHYEDKDNDR